MCQGWIRRPLLALFSLLLVAATSAAQTSPPARTGEIIVKFKASASQADRAAILADLGADDITTLPRIGASHARIQKATVDEAIRRYRGNSKVEFIEPNFVYHALIVPNDPSFPSMWALQNTGQTGGTPGADVSATRAWDLSTGSSSVLVAIIDTGIDYNHPDLAANIFSNPGEIPDNGLDDDHNGFVDDVHGYDFANNDANPLDDHGHGTHVSGTVGAVGNNALGVVGLNWHTRLMAVKFLDAGGSGSTDAAVRAIDYAVSMGAKVINASWGGGGASEALRQAIQSAGEAGTVFVAAAGNAGSDNDTFPMYPASYDVPTLISVAASDQYDQKPFWSNWGATSVDLAAPGDNILSTFPNGGYATLSGTSMATPHVTGTVALVFSRFPNIGALDAKNLILNRVDPVPAFSGLVVTGGRLNAFLAISDPDVTPPGTISDLGASDVNGTRVTMHWTATGDDGSVGSCSRYELRYSTAPINAGNFASATQVTGLPRPAIAGTAEQFQVNGLPFSTHLYFALKAFDEFGNSSPLSNVASATTLGPPVIGVSPTSLSASLLTGQQTTKILTISNAGPAELHVKIQAQQLAGAASATVERTFVMPAAASATSTAVSGEQAPRPYPLSTSPYSAGHQPIRPPLSVSDIHITNVQASSARILILQSGADVNEIRTLLAGFPDLGPVDVLDGSAVPTLAQLAAYQSILLVVNAPFPDPDGIGNVLADYVDSGGGLVMTLASFIGGWDVRGRLRSGGYIPFTLGGGPIGGSNLGTFNASHPIMAGVSTAHGELLGAVGLASGAELVASWAIGQPCLATKGSVVAMNVFVAFSGFWTGDVPLMLHNALLWTSTGSWLSAEPRETVVPAGGQLGAVVTFDAANLDGGDYSGALSVQSDDPIRSQIQVPTSLHVTGVPDIALLGDVVSVESVQDYTTDGAITTHHMALVAPPPSTSGTFDLEALGDYGDFSEFATLTVEGVQIGGVGATGIDCSLAQGSFPVSAAQLAAFLADGKIDAQVQNSLDVGFFCAPNRHTVRLRYQNSADQLAFGNVFVGGSRQLGVVVRNAGSNPLVVGPITTTSGNFSVSPSSFTLAPRTTQRVIVTFQPTQPISYAASLQIASNDPDESLVQVTLTGVGQVAPDITVSPVSFQETLLSGNQVSRTLTLRNDGGSDLEYALTVEPSGAEGLPVIPGPKLLLPPVAPPPPPAAAGDAPSSEAGATESATPAPGTPGGLEYGAILSNQVPPHYQSRPAHAFTMSGATVLLIQDVQPWGTTSNEAVLQSRHLSFDVVTTAALAGVKLLSYQKVIVASDQTTAAYQTLAARMGQLTDYVNAGGVLEFHAAGWGFNNGDASVVTLPGGMAIHLFYSSFSYFFTGHPLLVGVPNPLQGSTVSHAMFSSLPAGALVLGVNEFNQPVYVTYPMGHGLVIATGHIMEFGYALGNDVGRLLQNAIPFGLAGPASWLSASRVSGRIPPGGSDQITVSFQTAGLLGGDYTADLVLRTNDPDESTVRVPARMHIDPAPDIAVSGAVDSSESVQPFFANGAVTTHDLAATIPPASDGTIELIADGDFGDFPETATLEVEGIRLGSVGRTGLDCSPARGTFTLPAADLAVVAADGVVHMTVTNTFDVDLFCPVNQHTVRLTYTGRADLIDYGQVFVRGTGRRDIQITNRGLDPLHVQALAPTNADFHTGIAGAFVVAPRTTLVVPLTFTPSSATVFQAQLAIHSDDPDQPEVDIQLRGEGLVPPDIAVTPDHVDEHLFSGQSVERSLTIANSGGADLTFRVVIESLTGPGATLSLARADARATPGPIFPATSASAAGREPAGTSGDGTSSVATGGGSEGLTVRSNAPPQNFHAQGAHPSTMAGANVLLVEDVLPWGIPANELVLGANGIAFDVIPTSALASTNLSIYSKVIVASDQPTFSYLQIQAAMSHVADYVSAGGTLEFHAAGIGFSGGDPSGVTLPGGVGIQNYLASTNYVLDPSHPLVAGVPSQFSGNFASHSTLLNLPAQSTNVVGDDLGRPNLIVYPFGAGTVIASGQTLEYGYGSGLPTGQILRNMIPFAGHAPRPEWLSANPLEGVVVPGSTATLTLRLDATDLLGGDYESRVRLVSNDPDESEVDIPVHLAVTGAPDIAILGALQNLQSVQSYTIDGARTVHDLLTSVTPEGDGTLELIADGDYGDFVESATAFLEGVQIGNVGRTGTDCTAAQGQFRIPAADLANATADARIHVEVQNTPDVNVFCTVNEHRVRVLYRGSANPLSFGTLFVGQCATQHLLLLNRGTDVLTLQPLSVSDAAFQVSLPAGHALNLTPHDSVDVTVTFCPLYAAAIEAQLTFSSNDPDEPQKVIHLRGEGVVPPDIAVAPSSIQQALLTNQEATAHLFVANDGGSPLEYRLAIGSGPGSTPARARGAGGAATPLSAEAVQAARGHYQEPATTAQASTTAAARPLRAAAPAMLDPGLHANDFVWFFDDMEHGVNGWTHSAMGPDGLDFWAQDSLRSSSPAVSWHVAPHLGSGSEALQSPTIDLSGAAQPKLTFQTWYAFDDCGGLPDFDPDGGIVEIGDANGNNWTQIFPVNGYPYVLDDICSNPLAFLPAYAHHSPAGGDSFVTETFDLSAYAGQRVRLRFRAGWDCGNCTLPDGWFIDDVRVFSESPPWARTQPSSGTVLPGNVADVAVIFDASGLNPGTYVASLSVLSNDPDEPDVEVSLHLVVVDFAAAINPDPNTMNLGSRGQFMTTYLELPSGMNPANVVQSSLRMNYVATADPTLRVVGDQDHDGVPDLTLKFPFDQVRPTLSPGAAVPVVLTGALTDGRTFLGIENVRAIRHQVTAPNGGEVVVAGSNFQVAWSLPTGWSAFTSDLYVSTNGGVSWQSIASGVAGTSYTWSVPGRATRQALVRIDVRDAAGVLDSDVSDHFFQIQTNPTAIDPGTAPAGELALRNVPNPFPSSGTEIVFGLAKESPVTLTVYNAAGRRVRVLLRESRAAGLHHVRWDGRDERGASMGSGVYFLRLSTVEGDRTRRVALVR